MGRPIADIVAGALYAFGVFLTTRPQRLVASSSDHPEPVGAAVAAFLAQHKMDGPEVSPAVMGWQDMLAAPAAAPGLSRLTLADYEEVIANQRQLVRELDVALNGEAGAAKQASLCDLVAQVTRQAARAAAPGLSWATLAERAVGVLRKNIVPDGISDRDAIVELLGIFDGPDYRALVAEGNCAAPLTDSEQYRQQIAGICTAALGYWKDGDALHPDYDTPALHDVAALYAKYSALHAARESLRASYTETFGPFPDGADIDAQIIETVKDAGGLADLVRELDAALNGVPTGASLAYLVALVKSREPVQIVNLSDGMRINFRAPDGYRGTIHVDSLLNGWASGATRSERDLVNGMRRAIAAYPVHQAAPTADARWRKLDEETVIATHKLLDVVLENGATLIGKSNAEIDWTAVRDWRYSPGVEP